MACNVLGTFSGIFPVTGIDLLLVAVIVNLTKVMMSHVKHLRCKKDLGRIILGSEFMKIGDTKI